MTDKKFDPEQSLEETIISNLHDMEGKSASTPCLLIIAGQHIGKLYP